MKARYYNKIISKKKKKIHHMLIKLMKLLQKMISVPKLKG